MYGLSENLAAVDSQKMLEAHLIDIACDSNRLIQGVKTCSTHQ